MKGGEALAQALRACADTFYTVPGYPVTAVAEAVEAELTVNEKVALEYALGDSLSGRRAAVILKNVGLNACADPLVNATTQGLRAGIVIVAGDDLSVKGSQNAQDSRYYGEVAEVPVLEPSGDTMGAALEEAFLASERFSRMAILRVTADILEREAAVPACTGVRDEGRLAPRDLTMRGRVTAAAQGTAAMFAWARGHPLNTVRGESVSVGAVEGVSRAVVVYPPPDLPPSVRVIREAGRPFLAEHRDLKPPQPPAMVERMEDRGHARTFCPHCPFKPLMEILKLKGLSAACDMGCAILAMNPPYSVGVAAYGLGSSVAVAARSTGIALIGDYAILHSGINALIDVYEKELPLLCIVLANNRLGMVGETPAFDPVPYLAWSSPVIAPGDDPRLEVLVDRVDRPRTLVVEGTCAPGESYETVACGDL
jgi:TPP-dependent indolepyruvate ferredoxin oxidoreductase alpha subunit